MRLFQYRTAEDPATSAPPHVVEIWAEQQAKNAELHKIDHSHIPPCRSPSGKPLGGLGLGAAENSRGTDCPPNYPPRLAQSRAELRCSLTLQRTIAATTADPDDAYMETRLPKLNTRVRFPSSAPYLAGLIRRACCFTGAVVP